MISGAHKIDVHKDLPRLMEMIKREPNNQRIAETFRTHKGEPISNEMVRAVRKGKRWVKYTNFPTTETLEDIFRTEPIKSKPMNSLEYSTSENNGTLITEIKDKTFGHILIKTSKHIVDGVEIVVQTYSDFGYIRDKRVDLLSDDVVIHHMNWIRKLIADYKTCKDLFILPVIAN
jgi:hypothetical protein